MSKKESNAITKKLPHISHSICTPKPSLHTAIISSIYAKNGELPKITTVQYKSPKTSLKQSKKIHEKLQKKAQKKLISQSYATLLNSSQNSKTDIHEANFEIAKIFHKPVNHSQNANFAFNIANAKKIETAQEKSANWVKNKLHLQWLLGEMTFEQRPKHTELSKPQVAIPKLLIPKSKQPLFRRKESENSAISQAKIMKLLKMVKNEELEKKLKDLDRKNNEIDEELRKCLDD